MRCGCNRKDIQFKNEFTDTHCCKCKKAICIYKMNNEYHCKECQKNINNNKYSTNIDSQETIQQWNEFMEQRQNQPTTSYAQAARKSPYYSECQNCGKSNKKSKNAMGHFEGSLCHKCQQRKENFQRYGTTGKITMCEICGTESDGQENIQRRNGQIYFCDMRCQMIFLACERANNEDEVTQKLENLARNKKYSSYPSCEMFEYEGAEEVWEETKNEAIYYYKNGTKKDTRRTKQENRPLVALETQGILPEELREQIVEIASRPDPVIYQTFDYDEIKDELTIGDRNDILAISDEYDLKQYTQAISTTPRDEEFYEEQWGEYYIKQTPTMVLDTPTSPENMLVKSCEENMTEMSNDHENTNGEVQNNNNQLMVDLQEIGVTTVTTSITPTIPQTQIQRQTPELPKHEFADRKVARRASISDIQLNNQQQQVKTIVDNYDQMITQIIIDYNNKYYQMVWTYENEREFIKQQLEERDQKIDSLTQTNRALNEQINAQITQISELNQIIGRSTQLSKRNYELGTEQQQIIDEYEQLIDDYQIKLEFYQQWEKMSLKDKEEKENHIEEMKNRIIRQQEELVNLQDGYNRQRITTDNFKNDIKILEKENEAIKNEAIKNNLRKIQQESITKIDQEIQTEEMIIEPIGKPLLKEEIFKGKLTDNNEENEITENHLKGNNPIMKVYGKEKNNKKSKKRKASEIIPRFVKRIVRKK